ncbi:MAG TPA: polysaccharide deacetylase family protein [Gammaproteobacteria bacterium]|nr:polysaccharide deacetylase family protein [Gammaproteobacteria bacterium]
MAASFPALTFHTLEDQPSVIAFSPRLFQRGIARLHERGYRTVSLLEAMDCLRRRIPFPDRSFVITFDDGYQTVYDVAFPVLQRYGMSATVFLTVGEKGTAKPAGRLPSLSGRSMLSWHEIREMQRWGIAFGAHICTHPDLTHLPSVQIEAEVCDSKTIIEDVLSAPVACFAYPYGRYDGRSRDLVRQYFACACSDKLGLIAGDSDLYALERIDAYYLRSDALFGAMSTKLFPWYIRARSIPRRIRRTIQLSS